MADMKYTDFAAHPIGRDEIKKIGCTTISTGADEHLKIPGN